MVETIWRRLERDPRELLGLDDACSFKATDRYIVLNVDSFSSRNDWLPGMGPEDAGWKCLVMSASDIFAKGAKPLGCMVALMIPGDMSEDSLLRFYEGLMKACRKYGVGLWGGDLDRGEDFIAVVTCVGEATNLIRRSGARPGDLVYVTGEFGYTGLAYRHLMGGVILRDGTLQEALRRVYRPVPSIWVLPHISRYVTAATDSSDGLARSLHLLSTASGVRIVVEELPVADEVLNACAEAGLDVEEVTLYGGGEEYEGVFTVDAERANEAEDEARRLGVRLIRIGRVERGGGVFLKDGRRVELRGWDKLRGWG